MNGRSDESNEEIGPFWTGDSEDSEERHTGDSLFF